MTTEQDWANDGEDFLPDEQTLALLAQIDKCLAARNPRRYLERKYPSEDKLTIGQKLATYACACIGVTGAAFGLDAIVEGISSMAHIML